MVFKKISIVLMVLCAGLTIAMDRPKRPIIRQGPISDVTADSIFKAAQEGRLKTIKRMIAEGKNINQTDASGNTPLIIAALNGKTDVMNALISAGAKLDIKNYADQNAMFAAVGKGQVESVRTLLKAGVSPNQREEFGLGGGLTLLMIATQNNNSEIVKLLAQAGADLEAKAAAKIPAQQRTAGKMAESIIGGEEVKAYTTLKKEKIP
jgi:ankyrin repeat protein